MVISTQFEHPYVLLLISPLILAGLYYIRRGVSKWIIISRIIILSLLIMALASPYSLGISTLRDDAPKITVISDNTMSMDLFNKDLGKKVFDALQPKTPTKFREFAGIKSPIGDEVIGASENNNLVLITDGNANYGKDLFDAISFVSQTGTRVFAVEQKPLHNDISVEIASSKNIIIGNENVFNVVVRQAGNDSRYKLDVEIDGKSVYSDSVTQNEREKSIPVTGTFTTLGSHKIKAMITPYTEDRFKLNNVFYRSVFVVPKPKVLAVTGDTGSPLYTITTGLYDVTTAGSLPTDFSPYKAVIIDNKGAGELPADTLRNYAGNGGGLVVVGGESSYDNFYNNSSLEAILPIISRAGETKGGKTLVIIIDTSASTEDLGTYPDINANARYLVEKSDFGTKIGIVAFGGAIGKIDIRPISSSSEKYNLQKEIEKFYPEKGVTNLYDSLIVADKMLETKSGTKSIIIISDGEIKPGLPNETEIPKYMTQLFDFAGQMHKKNIEFKIVQITPCEGESCVPNTALLKELANPSYKKLAATVETDVEVLITGDRLKISGMQETTKPTPVATPEITREYSLAILPTNHFITKNLNITASITGYNDVTPKLGSDRLVATTSGKPILTTWGFGLGRVAAFTTDNGNPSSDPTRPWASAVYSGENSRLISSMINWAIGDPRPKEGDVINAEDIWAGTAGRIIVTSDKQPPKVELDGVPLELSRTGPTTYENSSIDLETGDFHDISGYGIAVNYPLEYREIGFNEKLKAVIESNGGRVYNEDEVEGLLFLDIKEKAVRTVNEPKSEKEPYLLAALVLFLTEVIIRRIKDYRKERPVIEENQPRTAQVAE